MDGDSIAVTLATVLLVGAAWEYAAVRWRRTPTISEIIEAGGLPARIAVVIIGSLALADHFLLHWLA